MNKLLVILLCFCACGDTIEKVNSIEASYRPSSESVTNVELIYSEDGQTKVILHAPKLYRELASDKFTEFPEGVSLKFYDDSLKLLSTLTAKYARRNEVEKKTYFRDSVVVINYENKQLYTDELIWLESQAKIKSDKFVKIVTDEERIQGMGFEANQDFSRYKILKPSGEIDVEDQNNEAI